MRRAYRALRDDLDVFAGADASWRFREVADAYDVLHDPRSVHGTTLCAAPRDLDGQPMP
jgi:DnaJ-class molecular chaperone